MEKEITNKYNINEELYFYHPNENKIIKIKVFAVTYDCDRDNTIKYNFKYDEDILFDTYDDAFMYARMYIKDKMNNLINELEEGDYDGRK